MVGGSPRGCDWVVSWRCGTAQNRVHRVRIGGASRIEPLQWIENIQLADSTMFLKARKAQIRTRYKLVQVTARLLPTNTRKRIRTDIFSLRQILGNKANSARLFAVAVGLGLHFRAGESVGGHSVPHEPPVSWM